MPFYFFSYSIVWLLWFKFKEVFTWDIKYVRFWQGCILANCDILVWQIFDTFKRKASAVKIFIGGTTETTWNQGILKTNKVYRFREMTQEKRFSKHMPKVILMAIGFFGYLLLYNTLSPKCLKQRPFCMLKILWSRNWDKAQQE